MDLASDTEWIRAVEPVQGVSTMCRCTRVNTQLSDFEPPSFEKVDALAAPTLQPPTIPVLDPPSPLAVALPSPSPAPPPALLPPMVPDPAPRAVTLMPTLPQAGGMTSGGPTLAPTLAPTPAPNTAAVPFAETVPSAFALPRKQAARSSRTNRSTLVVGLLGIVVVAGVAFLSYRKVVGPDDVEAPSTPTAPPPVPASPILVPINDAREVVAEINDNPAEEELLDELGLDPVGQPQVAGYLFTTLDADGAVLSIQVDATTGNYSIESATGLGFRSIDGVTSRRAATAGAWAQVDAAEIEAIQRFGLDGVAVATDVIPVDLAPYVALVSTEVVNGVETSIHRVDVANLRTTDPALMATWSSPFGLDPVTLGSVGTEPVTITMTSDAQGTLQTFVITPPEPARSTTYRLEAIYDAPPVISL
jgi:hypothetical protein